VSHRAAAHESSARFSRQRGGGIEEVGHCALNLGVAAVPGSSVRKSFRGNARVEKTTCPSARSMPARLNYY